MEFCNSHQVSHFSAFFIDARAKIFIVESHFNFDACPFLEVSISNGSPRDERFFECSLTLFTLGFIRPCNEHVRAHHRNRSLTRDDYSIMPTSSSRACCGKRSRLCFVGFNNDPSAGSLTKTLLQLLLYLNDKFQWTSRDVAGSRPSMSSRSEHFTGLFN
ncbi:Hypothetical predicted protein [Olea europaea subsp. europaea]|uniref:Uncharacterized protein n=1 Tax=Olea europaea subsp. europaea TaxID=158383 RepID=A0A8S0TQU2_OLEEU|nr:Hypothetical predicted protein [Olea europaea subsp. europaea]